MDWLGKKKFEDMNLKPNSLERVGSGRVEIEGHCELWTSSAKELAVEKPQSLDALVQSERHFGEDTGSNPGISKNCINEICLCE